MAEAKKTRISQYEAEHKGMKQCCCHRYFVPELKKASKKNPNPTDFYKSCSVCRQKRKPSTAEKLAEKEKIKVKKETIAEIGRLTGIDKDCYKKLTCEEAIALLNKLKP